MIPDSLYQTAIDCLQQADRIVLTTHVKPDADGLGALSALRRWLLAQGRQVEVILPTPPPDRYGFLDPDGAFRVAGRDLDVAAVPAPDLVCIVDTGTWQQLEGLEPLVAESGAEVLVVDHHATQDPLADVSLVDTEAAAAVMPVYRLLRFAGAAVDATMARDLYLGLVGDTDGFRLPNVGPEVHRLAAELVEAGAKPWDVHARLSESDGLAKFHLWGRIMQTLHAVLGGRATVLHVTREMFRDTGAMPGDTESVINLTLRVRGARIGVLLAETDEDNDIRVSLRSVPGVNVLQVAEHFGGGGHVRAAGARLRGTIDEAEAQVLEVVRAVLDEAGGQAEPQESTVNAK